MAYTPNTWSTGDVIAAAQLNAMEQGIVDAQNPTLATVASTGSYSDLTGTPTLATVATTGSYNDLTNKPAAASVPDATSTVKGAVQLAGDLGGTAAAPTVPGLTGKVDTTRTVSAGTGLTGGGDLSANRTLSVFFGSTSTSVSAGNHTHTATGISDSTTTGRSLITAASAAAARTTLSAPSVSGGVTDIVQLTQAAYTALGAGTVATTLYVIVG